MDLFGVLFPVRRGSRFGRRRQGIRVCPFPPHQQDGPEPGPAVPRFLAIHQFRILSSVSADLQSAVKKCSILFVLRGFEIPGLRGRTFLMSDIYPAGRLTEEDA